MVDAIRRIQPLIKRACIHTGSNPVLTTNKVGHCNWLHNGTSTKVEIL